MKCYALKTDKIKPSTIYIFTRYIKLTNVQIIGYTKCGNVRYNLIIKMDVRVNYKNPGIMFSRTK